MLNITVHQPYPCSCEITSLEGGVELTRRYSIAWVEHFDCEQAELARFEPNPSYERGGYWTEGVDIPSLNRCDSPKGVLAALRRFLEGGGVFGEIAEVAWNGREYEFETWSDYEQRLHDEPVYGTSFC